MLAKIAYNFSEIHKKLKQGKNRTLKPFISVLPQKLTPNQITLFRFVVVLVWAPFVFINPSIWQISIFFFVYFFDLVDGALAFFKNQATRFGAYFDPFSDRINFVLLLILLLKITNYQVFTLRLFLGWEIIIALFILGEYFLRKDFVFYREPIHNTGHAFIFIAMLFEIL